MASFASLHRRTVEIYDTHASAWDEQRPMMLIEQTWLDRFLACLPEGAAVLDIGCGAGEPMARYLLEQGCAVTGVDAAPSMLALVRDRFPDSTWHLQDMRHLALDDTFDGLMAWDSFFHLTADEQQETLPRFFQHLRPGGAMLFTIGDEAGEVLGWVNGERIYHASLDPEVYKQLLLDAGFADVTVVTRDPDCHEHSVVLACGYRAS